MKKLTTMLGLLALSCSALSAAVVNPGVTTGLKVAEITPEFKEIQQRVASGDVMVGETIGTRSYVGPGGTTYTATFQMMKQPLCELLKFSGEDGEGKWYTFDQLPYYVVVYTLTGIPKGQLSPNLMVTFYMEWPSEYLYNQIFEYDGETDENGYIPVPLREYQPASFDDLWNNDKRCREFREQEAVGAGGNPNSGKWSYYCMLPNEFLEMPCLYNGNITYTELTENIYSRIELQQFDSDDFYMEVNNNIRINWNGSKTVRCTYKGTGEVQGIIPTEKVLPEFGDVHLFNAGQISSASLGDENPFPTDFDQYTLMYFATGDKEYVEWEIDPKATKFKESAITIKQLDVDPEESEKVRLRCNSLMGYTFMDKKYADTSLNPDSGECEFVMGETSEVDLGDEMWMPSFTPSLNCLVTPYVTDMNGNYETWSTEYGTALYVGNLSENTFNNPVSMGWGYKQGFLLNYENNFLHTFKAQSLGKLYYHYDPQNMQLFRELELVGGKDAVETVAAEAAQISAANGIITVVSSENANVAVYSLDGVCLKQVKATAGETVNVEASKGIYVVTVNGTSKKVAL